jgi:hypothetical protein
MRQRTAEKLARLYPRAWRARFGPEFIDFLEAEPLRVKLVLDILRASLAERLFDLSGLASLTVAAYPASVIVLAKRPSAFIPIMMSFAALAVVILALAVAGVVREHDEGAAAHIFQLLITGEGPFLAFFILRWVRKDLRAALTVLAMQSGALGLALFPVWYFGL